MWCNKSLIQSQPQTKLHPANPLAYPCLTRKGHISLPLPWDPAERQVPLFILWEKYLSLLPHGLEDVTFIQIGAK